ncbi:MAG: RNA polymerase sigma factor [Spirochaetia bacterium]|jgi:RNA polymerase sigma-70 factor (ECF subfamily)
MIHETARADPDAAVVERIRAGETRLYEVLIRRYNQRLYRVARSLLHEDAAVDDVMQEAYLKAFTALPRFQGRALFSTWLTRILINCALAHLRSRSRRPEMTLDAADERQAANRKGDEEDLRLAQEQIGRLLEKTIDTLPTNYRVVFVMRELEGMSVAETAASLGISPVNAKVRLHRAKRLLREGLRQQMPDISLYAFLGEKCDSLTSRVMERILSLSAQPPDRIPAALQSAFPPGA